MVIENLDAADSEIETAAQSLTPIEISQLYVSAVWKSHSDKSLVCLLKTPAKGRASQKWFPLMETTSMTRKLHELSQSADTRLSWCSFGRREREDRRAVELPGLFIDIDVAGRHHERSDLPTLDEALEAVDKMPVPVSLLLDSGGGLTAIWVFDEPLVIDDRQATKDLLRKWEDTLRRLLPVDVHVDKAAALTAVPRVPGILNHKSGTAVQILRPDLQAGSYAQALAKSRKLVPRYAVDELQALMPVAQKVVVGDAREYSAKDKADALSAVAQLSEEQADNRETWIKAGLCLSEIGSSFDDAEDCFQVWCAFSRKAERFADTEEDDYRREWDSFSTDNRGGAVGTLVGMAQDSGNNKGGGEIQLLGVVKKGSAAAVPEEDDEDLLADTSDDSWPEPLAETALIGPVGDFVRGIEPITEADPAALTFQLMTAFGNLVGRNAWFKAEADQHCGNLYAVLVGRSAKGRKGTSAGQVRRLIDMMLREDGDDFDDSLQHWNAHCQADGLSTGAGLIWAVRDEVTRWDLKKATLVISDPGVSDKRLLVNEGEFSQILKVMKREGNDLSPVLRKAWDRGDLRSVVKHDPTQATGAHISIIGHITSLELKSHLTETEIGNGFGNRFLWVCVRRSKMLATAPNFDGAILQPVAEQLRSAVEFCGSPLEVKRSGATEEIWQECYPRLSRERFGIAGALLGRAEAQVMRLAMLYALLEKSPVIEDRHLRAALELWRYVEDSVGYVFGNRTGHPVADSIHSALQLVPQGMTRTEVYEIFSRNKSKQEVDRGLGVLLDAGLIERRKDEHKTGRPAVRFCAI